MQIVKTCCLTFVVRRFYYNYVPSHHNINDEYDDYDDNEDVSDDDIDDETKKPLSTNGRLNKWMNEPTINLQMHEYTNQPINQPTNQRKSEINCWIVNK